MKKKIENQHPHLLDNKNQESWGDAQSKNDIKYYKNYYKSLKDNSSKIDMVRHFPLFINRQDLIYHLSKYDLYKKTIDLKGSIVECGCHKGSGLLLFSKLTSIFEPYDIFKKVIGFDTFEGFPENDSKKDNRTYSNNRKGHLKDTNLKMIRDQISLLDENRFNSHIPKVEIVKGNALKTIPKYIEQNPHLLISLLYLDFDLYDATKIAIENFLPRMPKGAIIAFDEVNQKRWQGETLAMLESFNLNKHKLIKLPHEPNIAYVQL